MVTVTIDIPAIYIVDMSDHPAIRGIHAFGSLVINPPVDECASLAILDAEMSECTPAETPKEMLIDLTAPMVCEPGNCSVVIVKTGSLHGTVNIETLENSIFLPMAGTK